MCSSSSKTVDSSSKSGETSSGIHMLELHGTSCIIGIVALIICILILYLIFHKQCVKFKDRYQKRRIQQQQQIDQQMNPYAYMTRFKNSFRNHRFAPKFSTCDETPVEPPWNSKNPSPNDK